ncbi:hypothetical protein ACEPAG_4911 [Sanghuangporus baumii]
MQGSGAGESREHHRHRQRRLIDSNTSSGGLDRYVPPDRSGSRASTRSGTDSYVPPGRDNSSRDTYPTPRGGDPHIQHTPWRIDRHVPSGRSGSHASTGSGADSYVPNRERSGTPVGSSENKAPSGPLDSYRSKDDKLVKKRLAHKDIKPGMCVWAENRELEILSQYFGNHLLSRGAKELGTKHLELAVSKSGDDDPKPHVRTVMLTTFGRATSLKQRVYEDRWKECVPREPAVKECDAQYGPVWFERGLNDEGFVPGWILVHARNLVHTNAKGEYECLETEMSSVYVEELDKRAQAHENEFAKAALQLRMQGVNLAEPSQSRQKDGKRKR